jgi:hypothetical protein
MATLITLIYLLSLIYPSLIYLFLSITYLSLIHLSPIRHRPRQAEYRHAAAVLTPAGCAMPPHDGILPVPADSRLESNKIRKGMKTLLGFRPPQGHSGTSPRWDENPAGHFSCPLDLFMPMCYIRQHKLHFQGVELW